MDDSRSLAGQMRKEKEKEEGKKKRFDHAVSGALYFRCSCTVHVADTKDRAVMPPAVLQRFITCRFAIILGIRSIDR